MKHRACERHGGNSFKFSIMLQVCQMKKPNNESLSFQGAITCFGEIHYKSKKKTALTNTAICAHKMYLITLPNRLVNHKARSSFIGSKLASCLLASHWLYWCISDRPGPLRTFGLRAVHITLSACNTCFGNKNTVVFHTTSPVKTLLPLSQIHEHFYNISSGH